VSSGVGGAEVVGFAGLTAARALVRAGRSVIVLEARNRVGGRALNYALPGGEVSERGATFVGPTLWNGYMDGAVRSGERVAAHILAR